MQTKIKDFTDLIAWKEGHKLVLGIYRVTDKFPNKEKYSLIDQMRRASVSITSNISEGFTRFGTKDKIRFYVMVAGSLTELQNQLIIAKDIKYLKESYFDILYSQTISGHKLINGLIRSLRS